MNIRLSSSQNTVDSKRVIFKTRIHFTGFELYPTVRVNIIIEPKTSLGEPLGT